MGKVVIAADEKETIIYADVDADTLKSTRESIPVTTQRRFDVYMDVAKAGEGPATNGNGNSSPKKNKLDVEDDGAQKKLKV
jgi:hypothetical protein